MTKRAEKLLKIELPPSKLTKNQTQTFHANYIERDREYRIWATVRHDDRCENGHNTFSITGEIFSKAGHGWREESCGCIHEDIAKHFPKLAPLIKWHLTSTDGPMHYVANAVYHALEHGPKSAWVYFTGPSDPLNIGGTKERLVGYEDADEAKKTEGVPGYRVEWDEKTVKVRNLEHARSCAVWPEATDEDLTAPGLEKRLADRLPALMAQFKADVESLGFEY